MARTGHDSTQAPQPVHCPRDTFGLEPPPMRGRKPIAPWSQASSQVLQATPFVSTHPLVMRAFSVQGSRAASYSKQSAGQTSRHLPQNVHCPRSKSTTGYPARPSLRIPVGHSPMHLPQSVQLSVKASSGRLHGGRCCSPPPRRWPKSVRREILAVMVLPERCAVMPWSDTRNHCNGALPTSHDIWAGSIAASGRNPLNNCQVERNSVPLLAYRATALHRDAPLNRGRERLPCARSVKPRGLGKCCGAALGAGRRRRYAPGR